MILQMAMISLPGETVGDFFAGTGNFSRTCLLNGRNVVAVEKDFDQFQELREAVETKLQNACSVVEGPISMPLAMMPISGVQFDEFLTGMERHKGRYMPLPALLEKEPPKCALPVSAVGGPSESLAAAVKGLREAWDTLAPLRVSLHSVSVLLRLLSKVYVTL